MQGGRIKIDRRQVWLALLMVPLLLFVGVMAMRQGSLLIGGALVAGTLVCGLGTLPALSSRLDVAWDERGLAGPSEAIGPFILFGRATLTWAEIAGLGGTWCGYAFVEAADGRRIYWTELHRPAGRLFAALCRRRPDLVPPALRE